jgi:hypothetical protein
MIAAQLQISSDMSSILIEGIIFALRALIFDRPGALFGVNRKSLFSFSHGAKSEW